MSLNHPPGYLTKEETAKRLGVGVKTVDRRLKTEPILSADILKAGRRIYIAEYCVIRFFEHARKRGWI